MAETCTKADLVKVLATEAGITQHNAGRALDAVLKAIVGGAVSGGKVRIIGLGAFEVKDVPARPGRNPKTGEPVVIPAKRRLVFKAQANLVG